MRKFVDDDDGYLRWLMANQGLCVLNTQRSPRPDNLVLHRASCRTISRSPARGSQWTADYIKFCGTREELEAFARREVGGEAHPCLLCWN